MQRAAKSVFRNLTVEEDERLTPNGMTTPSSASVSSLTALVWAMEETEGEDLAQKQKWWVFRSCHRFLTGPEEFMVGAVMAIPTPGTCWVLVQIEDSEEELDAAQGDLGASSSQMGMEKQGKEKKVNEKTHTPHRYLHFLRRSPPL